MTPPSPPRVVLVGTRRARAEWIADHNPQDDAVTVGIGTLADAYRYLAGVELRPRVDRIEIVSPLADPDAVEFVESRFREVVA